MGVFAGSRSLPFACLGGCRVVTQYLYRPMCGCLAEVKVALAVGMNDRCGYVTGLSPGAFI